MALLLAAAAGAGSTRAADDAPPAPPADQATPEAAIRAFNVAVMTGDEATIRRVALPADGLEMLLKGPHAQKASTDALKKFMSTVVVTRAKPGDEFKLPDGKVIKIKADQVAADRAVVVLESSPLPTEVRRVNGAWKVDPQPMITLRRAPGSGPRRPTMGVGGSGERKNGTGEAKQGAEKAPGKGTDD